MGAYGSPKLPSPPGGRSDGLTDEGGIAPDGLPGVGGLDGFGGFGRSFIEEPVGRGQANRPEDVFAASTFLHANEFMDLPTREPTEEFHRGIEAAQAKLNDLSNGGLRVDGYAKPFGPTEVLAQRAVTSGHMAMPGPATMTEPGPEAVPRAATAASTPGRTPAQQADTVRQVRARARTAPPAPAPKPLPSLLSEPGPDERPWNINRRRVATIDPGAAQPQLTAPAAQSQPALQAGAGDEGTAPRPTVTVGRPVIMTPPIPLYRNEVLARQGDEWPKQHDAFNRLPGLSASEHRTYMETFAAEGGSDVNPTNGATAGITRTTLNDLIDRSKVTGIPKGTAPKALDRDERARVYRAYFDDALHTADGSKALGALNDPEAAAAFGDTLFRHGRRGGTEAVQNALNTVTAGAIAVDGKMGPATFGELRAVIADPISRRQFLDALAAERKEAAIREEMRRNGLGRAAAIKAVQGEFTRFDHLRFQKASQKSP